jgi:ribosomal protein S18 acetylase RimI-like enzyme
VTLVDLSVSLRPVAPGDAAFFYTARRDGFRDYSEAAFGPWRDDIQRGHAARDVAELPFEIVEQRGAPIGYLLVLREPDHLFLDEIALVPAARRRGLGSELVRVVMARARDAGLPLRLSVLFNNPAQRLYARLGFVVTHVEHPRVKMAWTPPA